ncbi:hypothetical protein [Paenibacillus sp. FJAT-27812]|uniref:hypothetical protein n=1 Tax=Paenibacillus sp. FJAT-27812 TaxID=1684143 RepID=UPI0006A7D14B|nr:hypothetical protein [Paenibacillus sp. FJAT-27812]
MNNYGLIVATKLRTLPALESFYMHYEDNETENVEGGYDTKFNRLFWINHKELNKFIGNMGESHFFSLHRVFLSYYESLGKLNQFWLHQIPREITMKQEKLILNDIEEALKTSGIEIYDSIALRYANYICNNGEIKYMEKNPFQEYLWSIQMNEFLNVYNISSFEKVHLGGKVDLLNSSYLFKGAIVKKEISSVLYEWANISSFHQSDFIKRISNILEIIMKDVGRNRVEYDRKTSLPKTNQLVYSMIDEIDSKKWRKYFFGIFNASDLFGTYSRHGSYEIKSISGLNTTVGEISIKGAIDDWMKNSLLPTEKQFIKIFEFWYFTTSYLIINWLRLPHFVQAEESQI